MIDINSRFVRIAAPIVFAVAVLAIWQLYCEVSGIKPSSLPKPTEVAAALWNEWGRLEFGYNAWVTIKELAIGYAVAILLGTGLAAVIHSSPLAERALYPWLIVSQMVPVVAIAPIFVIWTGFDIRPKVMVIALVSFFPIAVNTIDGLRAVDPQLLRLMRTLGASRWQRFRHAQVPAALPFVFSGLKVGAALAVIGAVFGEWVGSSAGLGYLILVLNNATETATMFAVIFLLAVIGVALFALVALLERLLLPWYYESRGRHRDEGGPVAASDELAEMGAR